MSFATLTFGLAGDHSLRTLGEGLCAFDGLLSGLAERWANDAEVEWKPFKISTDDWELWVQLDAVTAQESEAPARIAQAYLDLGIALACGVRPDPAICGIDAVRRLLAVCPAGASQLTLHVCGVWLTLDLLRRDEQAPPRVGATTLWADGILAEDLTQIDRSVAVVLPTARQTLRCTLDAELLPSVADLVGERIHLRGALDPTPTEADTVWLSSLERFELSNHWVVNPAEEQTLSEFQARWPQTGGPGMQAAHGAG